MFGARSVCSRLVPESMTATVTPLPVATCQASGRLMIASGATAHCSPVRGSDTAPPAPFAAAAIRKAARKAAVGKRKRATGKGSSGVPIRITHGGAVQGYGHHVKVRRAPLALLLVLLAAPTATLGQEQPQVRLAAAKACPVNPG